MVSPPSPCLKGAYAATLRIRSNAAHERIRADLKAERIGLAKNRLPADVLIEDVQPGVALALIKAVLAKFDEEP